jgi:hypothetical protein
MSWERSRKSEAKAVGKSRDGVLEGTKECDVDASCSAAPELELGFNLGK